MILIIQKLNIIIVEDRMGRFLISLILLVSSAVYSTEKKCDELALWSMPNVFLMASYGSHVILEDHSKPNETYLKAIEIESGKQVGKAFKINNCMTSSKINNNFQYPIYYFCDRDIGTINCVDFEKGNFVWTFKVVSLNVKQFNFVIDLCVYIDSVVFVFEDKIYKLDKRTGNILKTHQDLFGNTISFEKDIVYKDDKKFIVTGNRKNLYKIDYETLNVELFFESPVTSEVPWIKLGSDDPLCVSGNMIYIPVNEECYDFNDSRLYCVNIDTGKVFWEKALGYINKVFLENGVLAVDRYKKIYLFTLDGKELFKFESENDPRILMVGNGYVYWNAGKYLFQYEIENKSLKMANFIDITNMNEYYVSSHEKNFFIEFLSLMRMRRVIYCLDIEKMMEVK
jgi:outer membrane protein assembly factor BamB